MQERYYVSSALEHPGRLLLEMSQEEMSSYVGGCTEVANEDGDVMLGETQILLNLRFF